MTNLDKRTGIAVVTDRKKGAEILAQAIAREMELSDIASTLR